MNDERFRRIVSWALAAIIVTATAKFVATSVSDEDIERFRKVFGYGATDLLPGQRRHRELIEQITPTDSP